MSKNSPLIFLSAAVIVCAVANIVILVALTEEIAFRENHYPPGNDGRGAYVDRYLMWPDPGVYVNEILTAGGEAAEIAPLHHKQLDKIGVL